ncbi:MAG TPA: class I SAM-dependent methyltransferase [Ktedonobacteraceae bacterium]|nr:class I SAM-dependent methyltransferase [Ktedonobacteraceae bacterium]
MQTALERWQTVVQERATQMDAAYARLGRTSADFWDRRARAFHRATRENATGDPFYTFLRTRVTLQSKMLDVGAGTGRFTLALAPLVEQITALEPNTAMLSYLRAELAAHNLANVTLLQSSWEEAPADVRADMVICSHVLYPILEVAPFLKKLHAASKQSCYLYLRATSIDLLTAPLWRHFHGIERCLPPGYIHALDVLYELGIYANVEVVTAPFILSYPSLQAAREELLEQLILEDTAQTCAELETLLRTWLVESADGSWCSPQQTMTSAILWWQR